nr:HNH endonuclease signature motif containing protein [Planosporangium mesophilum]
MDQVQVIAQQVAALQLALIRQADGLGIAAAQGATSTAAWLTGRYRMLPGTARGQVTLAARLDAHCPAAAAAMADGRVNVEQAHVIAKVVAGVPAEYRARADEYLADAGARFGLADLATLGEHILEVVAPEKAQARALAALERAEERAHAGRELRLSPLPGEGRVRVTGWLDREGAAVVTAALDPLCAPGGFGADRGEPRTPGQRRADALVEVCRIACASGGLPDNGGDRPQVVVTVDYDTLRDRVGAATLDDGQPLSAAAARRLACDAAILPAVLDGAGQVLDVGRQQRLFTGPLRRALVLRDNGCAFPDCDRPPRWCEGHHVIHWADGGPTNRDNAVLLCGHHHRLIHHSDWRVTINPADGHPDFTPPTHIDPQQQPRRNRYHRRE